MRRAVAALAALLAVPSLAGAQRYWKDALYPLLYYTTTDKWWFGAHYARFSPVTVFEQPERYHASVSGDVAFSTEGSYRAVALADLPDWWDGWRASLSITAMRLNRLGYFGLGNATAFVRDSISPAGPYYYSVSRRTEQIRVTVQRRIAGDLRALVGTVLDRTTYRALPGDNVFRQDLASGTVDSASREYRDVVGRVGLVFDTRDNELDPHRGLLIEALAARGDGYSRLTGQARGYLQPFEPLTIAGRVALEGMPGSPPLAPLAEMESSELAFVAVGGYYSLRGYWEGRYAGPGKLLGGIEARYALLWAPAVLEVKLVAFYDVGRVFGPGESVRLTTAGLHHGGGGELAVRLGRNGLLTAGVGAGAEGARLLFGTTWSY
jgi:outer membrane protein assembly factor BamA